LLLKSEALRSALQAWGPSSARVEIVRWGVDPAVCHRDTSAAAAWRNRLGLGPEARAILSPRLLDPRYNIHLIVEALPAILGRVPQARLLLTEYGAVPAYRACLEVRIGELGLREAVMFLGQVPQAEMTGLYSLAEVVVAVPASDGLPQSLFEAMACEAPVVLGRLAAYGEVATDGQHALLADFTPQAVAIAVLQILEQPSFARALAERALARVQDVALLPREMDRLNGFYRDLLEDPPRRGRWLPRCADALSLLLRR
jgi:glycosyltransferase involved in cell wall biosynthesis